VARNRVRRPLLALVGLVLLLIFGYTVHALRAGNGSPHLAQVSLSSLPVQAAQTVRLIEHGGPYPYPHNDGVVFHNDEHLLPGEPDGYYHEYTVPTPGSPDRGARRIVTGQAGQYYYTGDHYAHFVKVLIG
jgi:ribonuclease T1